MATKIQDADYLFISNLLREHLGHDLGPGKDYLIEGRLAPLAAALKFSSASSLIDRLRRSADAELRDAVLEALLTGETSFFRTERMFRLLRERVIPDLLRARAFSRRLRIWCAACSTGQEAYSVAMLLADHFPELASWSVEILATDTSEIALRRAREGRYTLTEIQRGLPVEALGQHFRKLKDHWQIHEPLRRSIRFLKFNLLSNFRDLGTSFDVVLMCNVLIYLDPLKKIEVLRRLRDVIPDDGYLFLGESETILGLTDQFQLSAGAEPFYRPAAPRN